jgi:hypothetical protein
MVEENKFATDKHDQTRESEHTEKYLPARPEPRFMSLVILYIGLACISIMPIVISLVYITRKSQSRANENLAVL